ncbi:AAA family ATPase [Breznakiellaceae bacterium SP9]
MILRKIGYHEYDNQPYYWTLKDVSLEKINLLVGKNAIGKTRTIRVINGLGNIIAGSQITFDSACYAFEFFDDTDVYNYLLNISKKIVYEKLEINGEVKIERNENGIGKIFANKIDGMIDFQLQDNQIVTFFRRDPIQHPYLEKLLVWANGKRYYDFGSKLGQDSMLAINDKNIIDNTNANSQDTGQVAALFLAGIREYDKVFKKHVITSMKKIGYDMTDIDVGPHPYMSLTTSGGVPIYMINATENDRDSPVPQQEMSQGMFRALSLIIHVVYNTLKKYSTTILIDNIGEGLDFDRSSKLIKLLIEIAEKNENIQLIMSTNDRFVMNNVPLEYWQVIQRKGGECRVFNYKNSKDKFDEFEYTGLNNFDFLRTDFLNSKWEPV